MLRVSAWNVTIRRSSYLFNFEEKYNLLRISWCILDENQLNTELKKMQQMKILQLTYSTSQNLDNDMNKAKKHILHTSTCPFLYFKETKSHVTETGNRLKGERKNAVI